ncbi:hypothetical protein HK103_001535 [Boothiomyces macroporosus]|uniref:Cytokinin riboside 5'-monophosphate phosphoribohydrolase n=1 Tax=Boothiomyces macroporosus TaxID=261099 RepID=A0AAD5UEF2_9FUNG|nr:hypothetical protein HK103_001535 [Boothiomyces macroporosus]
MTDQKSICVFCASSTPKNESYISTTIQLGTEIALRGYTLVYGGSNRGMMGTLADSVLHAEKPSKVVGVLPESMKNYEFQHSNLTELHITDSMHSRKAKMEALSDGFLVLPGGIGTMEEFFEIYTWLQLNIHSKPIGIINVDGYFDGILMWLDRACADGIVSNAMRSNLIVAANAKDAMEQMDLKIKMGKDAVKGQYPLTWDSTNKA